MREDKRDRFIEELLDAALANHHSAEPRSGLEERVLANLRQQSRATISISWSSAPLMIAMAFMFALFAVEHLINHQTTSDPTVAVSNEPRPLVEPGSTAWPRKAAVVSLPTKGAKAATKPAPSSSHRQDFSHRQDLAVNLDSRHEQEGASGGLRIEEVRIAEVRLDDIIISNNERDE